MRNATALVLIIAIGCQVQPKETEQTTPSADDRGGNAPTKLPGDGGEAIPDLLAGEGPTPTDALKSKTDWYLHFHGTRGWIHGGKSADANKARQILITKVPTDSQVRFQLKVGDVVLGVDGKRFDRHPVFRFREKSKPAQDSGGNLSVIMWRKGWKEPRTVVLTPRTIDLTRGDKKNEMHDWNLGPTGARGWMWARDLTTTKARQILITAVEKGSPADGILQEDDVILGIDDNLFTTDARKELGAAIAKAEEKAGKGRLKLIRWRKGETKTVTIQLEILGSYSETAPFNCSKSEQILSRACAYLKKQGFGEGVQGNVNALGALATGRPEFKAMIRAHAREVGPSDLKLNVTSGGMVSWDWGYSNLFLTEYYLATGDRYVLPAIREYSENIAKGQSGVGTWGHGMAWTNLNGGKLHRTLGGYGAVNQCGIICAMSLPLAQKCGVDSPEITQAVERSDIFFSYYINKGTMPYGDHKPYEVTHDNNGANSSVAVFLDLAGNSPGARFFSRMVVASYGIPEIGHCGNYFSFVWGSLGANRSGSDGCAAFLKELRWFFDMERQWDGSFAYEGQPGTNDDSFNDWDCTGARLLMYSLPLKKLFITGRNMSTARPLKGAALADTIQAGRGVTWHNRKTVYDSKSKKELLGLLSSWSPIVRNRAAWSLGKRGDVKTGELVQLLRSGKSHAKLGALRALRSQKERSASAVPLLTDLLTHKDVAMRINAMHALAAIGEAARPAASEMFKLALKDFEGVPRSATRRNLCFALFNNDGAHGDRGLLGQSLDGINTEELFAAVRKLIRVDDAHARGCIAQLYKLMTFKELAPILPDIIWALDNPPPSGIMFGSWFPMASLKLLSDRRVAEGIPLLAKYTREQQPWASESRTPMIMAMLEGYGVHAKAVLPELKNYAEWCRTEEGFPEWARIKKREAVEAGIRNIEAATDKPTLISVKELVP